MKKNRRSLRSPRKASSGNTDGPSSTHSFLFNPDMRESGASIIVPETPTSSPCPSATLATIANQTTVTETPDDEEPQGHSSVSGLSKLATTNGRDKGRVSGPSDDPGIDDSDDSSVFDITPDLNLGKRKKKLRSILESEHSFTESLQSQDKSDSSILSDCRKNQGVRRKSDIHDFLSPRLGRVRRVSLAHVILPFDLNDADHLANKLSLINVHEQKSNKTSSRPQTAKRLARRSVNSPAILWQQQEQNKKTSNSPKVLFQPQRKTLNSLTRAQKGNNAMLSPSQGRKTGTSVSSRENDGTIHFDSEDVLLTPTHSRGLLVHQAACDFAVKVERKSMSSSECEGSNKGKSMCSNNGKSLGLMQKQAESSGEPAAAGGVTSEGCGDMLVTSSFPPPDPSTVLQGVVAYVEVRIESDNRSGVIMDQLKALGASVQERLNQSVTHVIFKDGTKSVFMRARKRGLHLLSSLWVEACRVKLCRVPEALYPSSSIEHYTTTALFPGRLRKMRSMQPKEFSEEEQLAAERARRRRLKLSTSPSPTASPPATITRPLFFTPQHCITSITEDVHSPLFGISHLLTPQRRLSASSSSSEDAEEGKGKQGAADYTNYSTPLAKRLYDRFISPKSESEQRVRRGSIENLEMKRNNHMSTENASFTGSAEELSRSEMVIDGIENMECQMSMGAAGDSRTRDQSASEQSWERSEEMASLRLSSDTDSHFNSESLDLPIRLDKLSPKLGSSKSIGSEEERQNSTSIRPRRSLRLTNILANNPKNNAVLELDSTSSKYNKGIGLLGTNRQLDSEIVASASVGKYIKPTLETGLNNGVGIPARKKRRSDELEEPVCDADDVSAFVTTRTKNMEKVTKERSSSESQVCPQSKRTSLLYASQSSQVSCSQARRHKLLSIDTLEPSQELIIPITPETSERRSAGAYTHLQVAGSRTQRKALKDQKDISICIPLPRTRPLKINGKNKPVSSITEDVEPSTHSRDEESTSKSIQKQPDEKQRKDKLTQQSQRTLRRSTRGSRSEAYSSGEESVFGEATIKPLPRPRRSTDEFKFDGVLNPKGRRKAKSQSTNHFSICLTSFHSKDKTALLQIIKKLGGGSVSAEVRGNTSHVVCGEERRTLSLLLGVARGCWVLSDAWLYESLEMNAWAPEEPFEMFIFAPAAKICREQRMNQGSTYHQTLFSGVGNICVLEGCSPPTAALKKLLLLCGAEVVGSVRCANLVVGSSKSQGSKRGDCAQPTHVSEKWVLECVMQHKVHPTLEYQLK